MKTAKKSNPQPFFSPKSRKWRKKSIARQHLHVPRSCRRRLAILQQLSLKQDDLEWPPLLPGCGTQHPLRALGGTRVLLAAAPTTPPCFRRWRRSSSLHSSHLQRNDYFYFAFGATAFAERSVAMKAPVGLLSGRAVCVSRWRGFAPTSSADFPELRILNNSSAEYAQSKRGAHFKSSHPLIFIISLLTTNRTLP